MKLEKKNGKHSGYYINLIIGENLYESYWEAPPTNVDHVGLEYAKNRYPIITTQKRLNEFKVLYKNLWIEITEEQRRMMEHTVMGSSIKRKAYRNYFFTNENDKNWNELINKGLAIKGKNRPNNDENVYFYLTKQGVEFILNKVVTEDYYIDL